MRRELLDILVCPVCKGGLELSVEAEDEKERRANGIPLHREVVDWFDTICEELSISPGLTG